jgi:hypothetical protein
LESWYLLNSSARVAMNEWRKWIMLLARLDEECPPNGRSADAIT